MLQEIVNCPLELQCSTSRGGGGVIMNVSHTRIRQLLMYFKGIAKVQCSSQFSRGVPPKVLVTSGTIAIIKMIISQIEWVYFKFKLLQK